MELMKIVLPVLLAILLAACSAQVSNAPAAVESPDIITPAPSPPASPTVQPTETPVATLSPTASPEPVFIVSDDIWAGAKEDIYPEIGGDYLAGGYVFVEPGTTILSPCDGVASFYRLTRPNGITMDYIIITVTLDKPDDPEELFSNMDDYPISFGADSITPSFGQYETINKGDELGIVNSANFDIAYTPEQQKERGCRGYNLSICCPILLQAYGMEQPFADELTLKDKIKYIVDLAKEAQTEETEED